MPVLSPVVWVVLIAAALQCATGLGWWVTSTKLENTQVKLEKCKQDHAILLDQTRRAGERAAEKARQIEIEQQRIADETAKSWAAALDFVRADAGRRMRLVTAGSAGGSGLSSSAQTGFTAVTADPDSIPPPKTLAADCAETTLTANVLQSYLERIEIAATEPGREKND